MKTLVTDGFMEDPFDFEQAVKEYRAAQYIAYHEALSAFTRAGQIGGRNANS